MADKLDCVVVGAGVVGLAIAKALAVSGREGIVLYQRWEKRPTERYILKELFD